MESRRENESGEGSERGECREREREKTDDLQAEIFWFWVLFAVTKSP